MRWPDLIPVRAHEQKRVLEHFPIPWNRQTSLDLCVIAFSSREPVSTSLENALALARLMHAQILPRLVLLPPEPNFRAEFGGIVNTESLIEFFGEIRHRGKLDAEFICNHRFRHLLREDA